ncbi:unnamed protein product [Pleuronectes platessa]|uniref:Uncharacterized protein n=1 Tax=Pleuronectes platessa TaxID=8262 RepID=A0A9N7UTA8_PLEPL|nr:unnamed protein product [Pleuronectes platessa]
MHGISHVFIDWRRLQSGVTGLTGPGKTRVRVTLHINGSVCRTMMCRACTDLPMELTPYNSARDRLIGVQQAAAGWFCLPGCLNCEYDPVPVDAVAALLADPPAPAEPYTSAANLLFFTAFSHTLFPLLSASQPFINTPPTQTETNHATCTDTELKGRDPASSASVISFEAPGSRTEESDVTARTHPPSLPHIPVTPGCIHTLTRICFSALSWHSVTNKNIRCTSVERRVKGDVSQQSSHRGAGVSCAIEINGFTPDLDVASGTGGGVGEPRSHGGRRVIRVKYIDRGEFRAELQHWFIWSEILNQECELGNVEILFQFSSSVATTSTRLTY